MANMAFDPLHCSFPMDWSRGAWLADINTPRGFSQELCSNMATELTDLNEEVYSLFVVYDILFSILMKTNVKVYYSF